MKRFIIQLAVFMLVLFTGLTVYYILISRFNTGTIESYKFNKGINKLIAGDSRTQYSINDKLIENSKNISQNSEGLLYTYYKLKTLLSNNPQIDTVFLGVSYHTFSSYYIDIQKKPDVSGRYFFILSGSEQFRLLTDTKNTFPLIQYSLIEGTKNWYNNTPDSTFMGGYDCYSTPVKISDSLISERIKFQFYNNTSEKELFEENVMYFTKIAELCKEKNVKLLILNTPMQRKYQSKVPVKFVNELNELAKKNNVTVIEFEGLNLSDDDFLPDGDHLQESGATKSTVFLDKFINKRK